LAAGSSSRMTKYKQLLTFKGKSLVKHIVEKASNLELHEIICVTGFLETELKQESALENILYVHNDQHKQGMTNSLKFGLDRVKETDAVLIMLTDQPLIPLQHYQRLIGLAKEESSLVIATSYLETIGVPAIFKKELFDEILSLNDTSSPKSLVDFHKDKLSTLVCEVAGIDIDTDEDYRQLIEQYE